MKPSYEKEGLLIRGLKNGEEGAYSYLVESYHHKLCVYASNLIHDDSAAEDIVQNVFVSIWKNRQKLKDDFSIKNFLYKSVHNEFIDQYRKNRSVLTLQKKYIDALESIIDENQDFHLEKMMKSVEDAIKALPPKCKMIFVLSKKEGLSNLEISEHLNISIKTVENQITKAFSDLRGKLGEKYKTLLFILFRERVPRGENKEMALGD
ncbi:RNA polymerase sigma-70 factor [Pricia sp. S334]|uniref:RNA polymerase sigma-70 factor n=1 Tax=Pricia mediterranea TaxID=3076079 RepID=A0ABU3L2P8_9FLAO|nr:RNA polymerase sigma-70 factor [Pricia sp. S334]MDT7828021.1 RNA polymerase sigma-70 factor [Pricia sp. S334]